ncbi:hypothetical protein F2Q68_00020160 [Brassica cretica]|uniref:Glycolipid transfer protein domain-containing protein n=1 Tax=Brassica cretica TaxID=69181 RepID=A0A8S9FRV0_BRACR|nr:hypothetical protein F2Q68_00020160 [Brassica cretica]
MFYTKKNAFLSNLECDSCKDQTASIFLMRDTIFQVKDLADASSSISTLQVMVDEDIEAGQAKKAFSHTRKLLRVKRALEMVRALFEEIIATEADSSLKDAAFKAYNQVLAPYHGHGLKESAETGMESLPTRALLLCMINETEETAKIQMKSYVTASTPVIEYLNKLFLSKKLGTNW